MSASRQKDTTQLQENLIRTHASGFGDLFPEDAVPLLIMLIRINSLVKGYSGIRLSSKNFWIAQQRRRTLHSEEAL